MIGRAFRRQDLLRLRGSRVVRRRLAILLLVVVAAILCFSRLRLPLLEPEEARYAEIPREMLAEDSWLIPVYHGQPYYDKPPLHYWLVMLAYAEFGVQDWAAHLVARFATFICVLVVYFGGRPAVGHRAALAGAFLLCLSARYLYLGRLLTLDGLLCLWGLLALAAAHRAAGRPALSLPWWLLSAVATGLGVLTKGPVALVLVAAPVFALRWLDGRAARPSLREWLAYLLAVAAVAGPWYLAVTMADPAFAVHFFWKHNIQRFFAPFDHARPFWFFLPELFLDMFPWTLLLPSLLIRLVRRRAFWGQRRPSAMLYWAFAALWCLLFFSSSGSKRAVYLLPAVPPLALALGCHLEWLTRPWARKSAAHLAAPRGVRLQTLADRLPWVTLLLVLTAGAGLAVMAAGADLLRAQTALAWGAGCALAAGTLFRLGRDLGAVAGWQLSGAAAFVLLTAGIQGILPAYAVRHSIRHAVHSLGSQAALADAAVVCYPTLPDSVSFYLRRNDVRGYPAGMRSQFLADVQDRPKLLAFVRSRDLSNGVLGRLPGARKFVPCGVQCGMTVGWLHRPAPGDRRE